MLDQVQRFVRVGPHVLRADLLVEHSACDTATGGEPDQGAVKLHLKFCDIGTATLGQRDGIFQVAVHQQNDKLVSAIAGQNVAGALDPGPHELGRGALTGSRWIESLPDWISFVSSL